VGAILPPSGASIWGEAEGRGAASPWGMPGGSAKRGRRAACGPEEPAGAKPPRGGGVPSSCAGFSTVRAPPTTSKKLKERAKGKPYRFRGGLISRPRGGRFHEQSRGKGGPISRGRGGRFHVGNLLRSQACQQRCAEV
jgi:hypothetical protein